MCELIVIYSEQQEEIPTKQNLRLNVAKLKLDSGCTVVIHVLIRIFAGVPHNYVQWSARSDGSLHVCTEWKYVSGVLIFLLQYSLVFNLH